MFLNIAICDDDPEISEQIKSYIDDYQISFDHDFELEFFSDGISLLSSEKLTKHNILFLDVEMPLLSGIDTAKQLRDLITPAAKIVFISNYPEYMQNSFSVHPYHYLQKPISREIVYGILSSVIHDIEKERVFITITRPDLSVTTLNINDLLFIESANSRKRIVSFHCKESVFSAKGTLAKFEDILRGKQFLRCQKSILVNIFHIHYLHSQEITLDTGERIPIGRSYVTDIRNKLSKIIFHIE